MYRGPERGTELAGRKKNPKQTEATRKAFLKKAYELFSTRNIETVSMIEIAKKSGYGTITLYRYYSSKPDLVVAVAAWKWGEYMNENLGHITAAGLANMTAYECFEFYLDSLLDLYDDRRDMLRFNQFFNIYVHSEHISPEAMAPYQEIIEDLKDRFHIIYEKAGEDRTLRTDISEEEMFSTTIHLMLAAAARYAVGLVYIPENGFDDRKELRTQKEMLLARYGSMIAPAREQ